jgi:hypothetical protein
VDNLESFEDDADDEVDEDEEAEEDEEAVFGADLCLEVLGGPF